MIDFSYSQDDEMFRQSLRRFLEKEVAPVAAEAEETGRFPKHLFKRFGEMGYLGIPYPEELGGMALGYQTFCMYAEELGRVNSGIAGSILAQSSIGVQPLFLMGSTEQKERLLAPALRGEKIGAFALTEPGAGSDAAGITTLAEKKGDRYVLNGTKIFITNATMCDYALVAATTDRKRGIDGIVIIVVERGTKGFSTGAPMKKLGNRSSECCEVVLEDCEVPIENRLGPETGGFHTLMRALNCGRMVVAARAVGLAVAAHEAALAYAKDRKQFGKTISSYQLIQSKLARMAMEIEASRALVQRAAWVRDTGGDPALSAAMSKLKATETVVFVTSEAVQILGGYGYMVEFPVERYFRDAKALTIIEGTSEIQQIIIARRLLE
jgi:alkylation response protein AidB-like acyl-CoA dehydrogenase